MAVVCAAILAPAGSASASEPAGSPQLYVASGDGYLAAFAVEGGRVSVLGVDATVYCEVLEPREASKPALDGFFAAPVRMRRGPGGFTASSGGGNQFFSHELTVTASFEGERLLGGFQYSYSEGSGHCQTAGYFGTRPEVAFEAVPYYPVDGSTPPPPFADSGSAVYYGVDGPLETFFSVFGSAFGLRGTVVSGCHAPRGRQAPVRGPLGSSVVIGTLAADGTLRKKAHLNGPGGNSSIKEAIAVAATIDDAAIIGTYRDRVAIHAGKGRKRVCRTGPLALDATRYLPATS